MAKPRAHYLNVETYPQVVGMGWYKGHFVAFLSSASLHSPQRGRSVFQELCYRRSQHEIFSVVAEGRTVYS